jgi:hypothetical protein
MSDLDVLDRSYVTNCYLQVRENETADYLFRFESGDRAVVKLDGYAIIPMEEYRRLRACGYS